MNALPAILRFDRLPVERIWGGNRLGPWLGLPSTDTGIGESWEIYDRGPEGSSRLFEPVAGCSNLRELMERHADALLGDAQPDVKGRFPLMLKFLDARERLSLQVHPDDSLAEALGTGDSGKDEAWVVLRADPGSWLMRGLVPGVSVTELFGVLEQGGDPEPLLQRIDSREGGVVEIPAGTAHFIGPGNLLYEIQKNSDLTYRLSDWGRLGQDGQPRDLHLAEGRRALEALVTEEAGAEGHQRGLLDEETPEDAGDEASQKSGTLVDCSAFFLERLLPEDTQDHETRHLPQVLTAVRGSARIRCGEEQSFLKEGETCLIRGGISNYTVSPEESSEVSPGGAPEGAACELLLARPENRERD